MGLPSGGLNQPLFPATPTSNPRMQYGGSGLPATQSQAQPSPLDNFVQTTSASLLQSAPVISSAEAAALQTRALTGLGFSSQQASWHNLASQGGQWGLLGQEGLAKIGMMIGRSS